MIKIIVVILIVILFATIFLKKKNSKKQKVVKHEVVKQPKKKHLNVALLVGHNAIKKGAYSNYLKSSEYDYWLEVAKKVNNARIFVREYTNGSYTREMEKAIDELNAENFDLVLELHFNAGSPQAKGCEVLVKKGDRKAYKLATDFICKSVKDFNSKPRKIIEITKDSPRGTYGILNSNATYLLTELFFGSNAESLLFKDTSKVANFIERYIEEVQNDL